MKTYIIFCGNYRHFEVDADNQDQARKRFINAAKISYFNTMGFSEKDITKIEEKEKEG